MIAVAVTMLVTIPLYLRFFGAERYGILATVWVFFGYFSVLDFGMGPAIVNMLSQPDRQDGKAASGVFWTAITLNLGVGVVLAGMVMAAVALTQVLGAFEVSPISAELLQALPWLLLLLPISLVYPILVGALDARRLFGLANANQVLATIAGQALPLIAVAVMKPTLTVAIAGSVLGRVVSAGGLLFFCVRKLELTKPRFEPRLVRKLLSFGGWVALTSGTGLILDTADRLVIASLLGGVAAAWYTIAYNVVTRARVLPQAIARVLYPQVSANPTGAMHVLIGSARVLTLILVPALAIGMVLIDPLCRLWIGESATKAVVPIARIMMLGVYLNCIAYVPLVALQARGDPDRLAKIHVMETPVFLIVIYLSTKFYGVTGAAIAWSVRLLIDTVILLWVAELKRVLYVDALLYMVVLLSSFAIASMMLLGLWVQVGATFVVLVTWMVVDTVIAGRTPESVTVLTLGSWARARFALVWSRSKL